MTTSNARKRTGQRQLSSVNAKQLLIIGITLILVGGVLLAKQMQDNTPLAALPLVDQAADPEAQLDQLLGTGHPILVFFHSMTCDQCIQMVEIVGAVHPEFADTVALVDVDVYESRNQNLITRSGIRMIPTLIFIDHSGEVDGYVGVMEHQVLRDRLQGLIAE